MPNNEFGYYEAGGGEAGRQARLAAARKPQRNVFQRFGGWLGEGSFLGGGISNAELGAGVLMGPLGLQYLAGRKGLSMASDALAGPQPMAPQGSPGLDSKSGAVDAEMEEYIKLLKGELDPNSPAGLRYQQIAASAANQDAKNRGIQGGLSGANTQNAVIDAMLNYRGQGLDRFGNGLGMVSNRNLQQTGLADARYENEMARYQQAVQQWNDRRAMPYKVVGGVGGAVAGGYVGGPQGAAAGAQAGYGLGGMFAPQTSSYSPRGGPTGVW